MGILLGVLLLLTVLFGCGLVNVTARPRPLRAGVLAFFLIFNTAVVLLGYAVSLLGRFGQVGAWLFAAMIVTAGLFVIRRCQLVLGATGLGVPRPVAPISRLTLEVRRFRDDVRVARPWLRAVFIGIAVVFAIVTAVQLYVILAIAPVNWDSMTCHLARMAYFFQHGSLDHYDANFVAQTVHGRVGPVLFAFAYLVSGGNENLTQAVQFVSSLALAVSVYVVAIELGASGIASAVAGMVASLMTINVLQATTTQLDLLGAGYLAAGLVFLLRFNRTRSWADLVLGAIGLALPLGLKSSNFLPLPAIAVVVILHSLLTVDRPVRDTLIGGARAVMVFAIAFALLALPYSYLANYRKWGHIAGPQWWREKHSLQGYTAGDVARGGAYNAARFAAEMLCLDGLPDTPAARRTTAALRWPIRATATAAGVDLEPPLFGRFAFRYDKPPATNEDSSFPGPAAWLLVLPAIIYAALGRRSRRDAQARVLVWPLLAGAVVFYGVQCVSAPYDPFRGRYFMSMEVLAVPLVALLLDAARRAGMALLTIALGLTARVAIYAVLGPLTPQDNGLVLPQTDRIGQLTSRNWAMAEVFHRFESLVPPQATVAVAFDGNEFEYPLFGRGLTRKLRPVTPILSQPNWPGDAQYLVFRAPIVTPQPGDILLGHDLREYEYYLRDLRPR